MDNQTTSVGTELPRGPIISSDFSTMPFGIFSSRTLRQVQDLLKWILNLWPKQNQAFIFLPKNELREC